MFRPVRLLPGFAAALCLVSLPGCKGFKLKGKDKPGTETLASAEGTPPPPVRITRSPDEEAFLAKCAEMAQSPGTITGREGWFFDSTELNRLALLADPTAPSIRSAVAAISHYRDQLKREGTELVFVPVPPKAVIYPDKLSKDLKIRVKRKLPARLDSSLQETWEALRQKGVRVIDVTDALLADREGRKLGPAYAKTAAIWTPRGAEIAAGIIAREFKDAKWAQQPGKAGPLITEAAALSYTGPLAIGTVPAENFPVRNIGRSADGKMSSVTFSQGGHALALIGDESILAWRENQNPPNSSGAFASLADQLAFELQTTPDIFPSKTDGRNSARLSILRDGTRGSRPLGASKVVLWVIQATDLAVNDWKKVPLRLEFNVSQPELELNTPTPGGTPQAPMKPGRDSDAPLSTDPGFPELPR